MVPTALPHKDVMRIQWYNVLKYLAQVWCIIKAQPVIVNIITRLLKPQYLPLNFLKREVYNKLTKKMSTDTQKTQKY